MKKYLVEIHSTFSDSDYKYILCETDITILKSKSTTQLIKIIREVSPYEICEECHK